ncbi:MAG: zinc-dependent peptidase, partial [Proteobacteria bacterium]|nr:zinc-dependent peptidase [Pseudomonadota bacterium]
EEPFPAEWLKILEGKVAYYRLLSPEDQAELRGHIQVFLREKSFEGMDGIEITDGIRVSIAAQACVLLLHRETDYYPTLKSIIVYPQEYYAEVSEHLPGGVVAEGVEDRAGESWHRGEVVLSWADVEEDNAGPEDGFNVVFHEFAHQLDGESGEEDGTPVLPEKSMYPRWAEVMGREYQKLQKSVEHRKKTFLDEYAAEHPAEFFAVITEYFLEKPVEMKVRHPEIYELLNGYYRQDPAARFAKGS